MRLHNPIPEINAKRSKGNTLVIATKVHWTYSVRLHGHNRLQSVMTEAHGGNGGTKVVDQLLIDISTGDSSVVGSQSSARDNIQTKDSGKSVSRKKSTGIFCLLLEILNSVFKPGRQ